MGGTSQMRKFAIYALAGMLSLPLSGALAAQSNHGLKPPKTPPTYTPTPVGFSSVMCVVNGLSGATLPASSPINLYQTTITALGAVYPYGDYSAIDVSISNGGTTGNFTIIFQDSTTTATADQLDCGDLILSVQPLAS
jgi:hypothetical protein